MNTFDLVMDARELSLNDLSDASGGAIALLPIAIAFGKGMLTGAGAVTLVAAAGDALDFWDVM